jgi:hypothetical protein
MPTDNYGLAKVEAFLIIAELYKPKAERVPIRAVTLLFVP